MASFVDHTPELQGRVTIDQRRIYTPSGATLTVLAADKANVHGLRPYWLVVDELANWEDTPNQREKFDGLWAGLPKVPDSRGIIITTAGTPAHFAAKIFRTAQVEPSWRAPTSMAHRLGRTPKRSLPSSADFPEFFARFWLNEWANPTTRSPTPTTWRRPVSWPDRSPPSGPPVRVLARPRRAQRPYRRRHRSQRAGR